MTPRRIDTMNTRPLPCLAMLLLAFATLAAPAQAAKIYKWTDAQGKVHMSDTPPSDAAAVADSPRPASGPATAAPTARAAPARTGGALAGLSKEEIGRVVKTSSIDELARMLRPNCRPDMSPKDCDVFSRDLAQIMKESQQDQEQQGARDEAERQRQDAQRTELMRRECANLQTTRAILQQRLGQEHPPRGDPTPQPEWDQGRRQAAIDLQQIDARLLQTCVRNDR